MSDDIDDIDLQQSLEAAHQYISELQERILRLERAVLVLAEWPNGLDEYVRALVKSKQIIMSDEENR